MDCELTEDGAFELSVLEGRLIVHLSVHMFLLCLIIVVGQYVVGDRGGEG